MNGLELLALVGVALTAAVTTLVSVALWHRRQLAEIAELKADAARVRDNCVQLWRALTPEEQHEAPLSATQRAMVHSMLLLAELRTALTRLRRKS